jgi:uncharacterized protein YaaW (UPF0174 family)
MSVDYYLRSVLDSASNEELKKIVEYITQDPTERLTKSKLYRGYYPDHKRYIPLIEEELRRLGGYTAVNFFRRGGVPYKEIVIDVAEVMRASFFKDVPIEAIEWAILTTQLIKMWRNKDQAGKLQFVEEIEGYLDSSDKETLLKAAEADKAFDFEGMLERSKYAPNIFLHLADNLSEEFLELTSIHNMTTEAVAATLSRASRVKNPILAGPAYHVTIPCVLHIAVLRLRQNYSPCPKCRLMNKNGTNFCPECGTQYPSADTDGSDEA